MKKTHYFIEFYQTKRGKGKGRWRGRSVSECGGIRNILLVTGEAYVKLRDCEKVFSIYQLSRDYKVRMLTTSKHKLHFNWEMA